jgi:UDP-N-acetylglucosamine 2-epimerase (non-hydrolysing)
MAPVVSKLRRHADSIESRVCVTAQHREMLDQVLKLFGIIPDHDLNIMQDNQSLASVASSALSGVDEIITVEKPDWILTQGDTTTAMIASLAGFYRGVKVGHVEAGLRTWNRHHPFPEEINRKVADAVADLHFAPTEEARSNLLREGIAEDTIKVTGNTVIDALLQVAKLPCEWDSGQLAAVPRDKRIILVTAHRRENFGKPLLSICRALAELAARGDVTIVYPVHLNPNVADVVRGELGSTRGVVLLEPLDYLPMVHLMKASYLILTDSGGLQEEAPGLGKPVLVMRETTERPEGVAAGTVKLVGTDTAKIINEVNVLLDDGSSYLRMAQAVNPYGDGKASQRIVECLLNEASRSGHPL